MAQKFFNCYKKVLSSLCDFSNWRGTSAKWLDECSLSEDDVTVSLYEISPLPNDINDYFKGGSTFDVDNYCYKIVPGLDPIQAYALDLLFNYM